MMAHKTVSIEFQFDDIVDHSIKTISYFFIKHKKNCFYDQDSYPFNMDLSFQDKHNNIFSTFIGLTFFFY